MGSEVVENRSSHGAAATLSKPAGTPCPSCRAPFPAEYAQAGQPAQWTCHSCGAAGELSGPFSIRGESKPEKQPAGKPVLPANRGLLRSRSF